MCIVFHKIPTTCYLNIQFLQERHVERQKKNRESCICVGLQPNHQPKDDVFSKTIYNVMFDVAFSPNSRLTLHIYHTFFSCVLSFLSKKKLQGHAFDEFETDSDFSETSALCASPKGRR